MLRGFTRVCVNLAQKWLPDSFVLVAILSVIVFFAVLGFTNQAPLRIVENWGNGAWSLLAFSMQMALILVLGQALASAKIISNFLQKLAEIPKNYFSAIVMVSLLGMAANIINWGFGLVISAIFAKEIAKKVKGIDYRLLIAAAYSGFVVWHGGLSGSIPLTLASGGDALSKSTAGLLTEGIPSSMTIFSTYNLVILGVIVCVLPFLLASIHPTRKEDIVEIDSKLLEQENKDLEVISHKNDKTLAVYLENSFLVSLSVSILGFAYLINYFAKGGGLSLNVLNMIFLFLGILLHKKPASYIKAIGDSAKNAAGILLQFPFYAGIIGMMVGTGGDGGVSLAAMLSQFFISISNSNTFAVFAFWSAGFVNILVPSGGGQWAVQAPIMIPAGLELGIEPSVTAMAIAWGDAWTNMIQPFWALPALAIAGLGAKDIMGYCVITLLFTGAVISLAFLFLT